jgi:DNA-binding transcriptional ArsR family regulator
MHPLDALGSPARRDILRRLCARPCSVAELAAGLPVSRPAVSRHLRVLRDAGLVDVTPAGNQAIYSVRPEGFEPVRAFLAEFWDAALARLQELARE